MTYGIAENKEKIEVYSKAESNITHYKKTDIVKLTFNLGKVNGVSQTISQIYPNGFTLDNSVILSIKWAWGINTPNFTSYCGMLVQVQDDGHAYVTPDVSSDRVGGVDKLSVGVINGGDYINVVQVYLMKVT